MFVANASPVAQEALVRIAQLYAIEQQGKSLSHNERRVLRQTQAVPVLDDLYQWLVQSRTLASTAIGKKNWLFTSSEQAGKRAAAIQSLLATAKLNGLDPAKWLSDTLAKLPTWPNSRIDELLPLRELSTV